MPALDLRGGDTGFLQGLQVGNQMFGQQREQERRQALDLRQQEAHGKRMQLADIQLAEHDEGKVKEKALGILSSVALNGALPSEAEQVWLKDVYGFDLQKAVNGDYAKASKLVGGLKNVKDRGRFFQVLNSPEALEAFNTYFEPNIKTGVGQRVDKDVPGVGRVRGVLADKRAVQLVPAGGGGLAVELMNTVKTDDGEQVSYRAPVTVMRGSDPDEPVMGIPFEKLMQQAQGIDMLDRAMRLSRNELVKLDPELRKKALYGEVENRMAMEKPTEGELKVNAARRQGISLTPEEGKQVVTGIKPPEAKDAKDTRTTGRKRVDELQKAGIPLTREEEKILLGGGSLSADKAAKVDEKAGQKVKQLEQTIEGELKVLFPKEEDKGLAHLVLAAQGKLPPEQSGERQSLFARLQDLADRGDRRSKARASRVLRLMEQRDRLLDAWTGMEAPADDNADPLGIL